MPEFEKINPSFVGSMQINQARFLGLEMVLEEHLRKIKSQYIVSKNGKIFIQKKFHKKP